MNFRLSLLTSIRFFYFIVFFSVAYVSRSGGMSNELNNIIAQNSNGVYEGIAIGGDRYPGSTYVEHILRYEEDEE